MATQVVLLERVDNLGDMGEVVSVKPGYARNFLLPQKKALRASKENIAFFEAQKKQLQADSDKRKKEAEKLAKTLEGLKVPMIRQASEAGQLFGSVTSRDIAAEASAASKTDVARSMVQLNQNFKTIGLFPVEIALHPEVKVEVIVNIARTAEEAQIQAETGKALIAETDEDQAEEAAPEEVQADEAALEEVLEEGALEAEKEKQAAEAEAQAKADEEARIKAEKAAAEAAAQAEAEAAAAADAEGEAGEAAEEKAETEEEKPADS